MLRVFGIEGDDFAPIQVCIDEEENSALMAWELLASNRKGKRHYKWLLLPARRERIAPFSWMHDGAEIKVYR